MEHLTAQGHPLGMLDRDQRTARLKLRHHTPSSSTDFVTVQRMLNDSRIVFRDVTDRDSARRPHRTSPNSQHNSYRKNRPFWISLSRLRQGLLVSFYLTFITFPCSLAAPTSRKSMNRMSEHPKWINPCGLTGNSQDGQQISDLDLLTRIVDQANIAYTRAKQTKEEFAQKTFNMDFDSVHKMWKDNHYPWLPSSQIPKELGGNVCKGHLEHIGIDEALLNSYENLQKIAVGLEQVTYDETSSNGQFKDFFVQAEHNLRNVLCEIQMTLRERNVDMRPDVTRDIMSDEFRNMSDATNLNFRNFLIYRDYMNMLEYVVETFSHLKSRE